MATHTQPVKAVGDVSEPNNNNNNNRTKAGTYAEINNWELMRGDQICG
jgi:hypothetical protein